MDTEHPASVSADATTHRKPGRPGSPHPRLVYIVDDDSMVRRALFFALTAGGYSPRSFASGADFLDEAASLPKGCVLLDLRMPQVSGMDILDEMRQRKLRLPVIIITGHGEVADAVAAMKRGAVDFLEKPFGDSTLFEVLDVAFERLFTETAEENPEVTAAIDRVSRLSRREHQVLQGLLSGLSSKELGTVLGISSRTVEAHRANLIDRLEASSSAEAVRLGVIGGVVPLLQDKAKDGE